MKRYILAIAVDESEGTTKKVSAIYCGEKRSEAIAAAEKSSAPEVHLFINARPDEVIRPAARKQAAKARADRDSALAKAAQPKPEPKKKAPAKSKKAEAGKAQEAKPESADDESVDDGDIEKQL